jgi:hypothetical protein
MTGQCGAWPNQVSIDVYFAGVANSERDTGLRTEGKLTGNQTKQNRCNPSDRTHVSLLQFRGSF